MAKHKINAVLLPTQSALIGLLRDHRDWREIASNDQFTLLAETGTLH